MTRNGSLRAAIFCAGLLAAASSATAGGATITIFNTNVAGVGFNDPTRAAPVGGNTGTTVGQQRLIAFQAAANIWALLLDSPVEIRILASLQPRAATPVPPSSARFADPGRRLQGAVANTGATPRQQDRGQDPRREQDDLDDIGSPSRNPVSPTPSNRVLRPGQQPRQPGRPASPHEFGHGLVS
jgi:hypothetical protein